MLRRAVEALMAAAALLGGDAERPLLPSPVRGVERLLNPFARRRSRQRPNAIHGRAEAAGVALEVARQEDLQAHPDRHRRVKQLAARRPGREPGQVRPSTRRSREWQAKRAALEAPR